MENLEQVLSKKRAYGKMPEIMARRNEAARIRKETDANFKLLHTLRTRIGRAMSNTGKRKSAKTVELIGCTVEYLKGFIEAKFKPGMTWENHGKNGWHLDHKIPCAEFDLRNPAQQKLCFHYTNLPAALVARKSTEGEQGYRMRISHTEIAKMRHERGVLAKQLAGELKVSDVHLSYVENGHRQSVRLVEKAVAFLSSLPKKS